MSADYSKATKGPWSAEFDGRHYVISDPDGFCVATVGTWDDARLICGFRNEEAELVQLRAQVAELTAQRDDAAACLQKAFDYSGGKNAECAQLRAANERLRAEMLRYLPVICGAEKMPEAWSLITLGTGVATANSYREALRATEPKP